MVITINYGVVVFDNVSLEVGLIQVYEIPLSRILNLIVDSVAMYLNCYCDYIFRVKKDNHVNKKITA